MSKLKFHKAQLKNGLTVIGEERTGAVSTALGFFVRTGSRDETPEVAGVSHFLEHMMFKGTARRSALDITYDMAAIGAQANAFTSVENTVYYAAVLPEYIPDIFDILADMLRPALDKKEFDTEKKVILEEIALYHDRPSHVLFEEAMRQFFLGHLAGNSVLGSIESITALSADQMREYFDRRYSPQNIVLTVTGQFVWDEFVALAEKHCAGWTGDKIGREYQVHTPAPRRIEKTKQGINTTYLSLVAPGPSLQEEERYSMQVLANILGDSSGSRIFWNLVDKGLCDSASLDAEEMDRSGMVFAYASCSPDNISDVEERLHEIMRTPLDFTEQDLERAKTKIRTRLALQGESSMRRLVSVGMEWLYEGRYTTPEQESAKYAAVTRKTIEAALKKYPLQPLTQVVLAPAEPAAASAPA